MNKTPEQILEEVSTTNPNEIYLSEMQECEENKNEKKDYYGYPVSYHYKAWTLASEIKGRKLFRYTGSGVANEKNENGTSSCGCLTQVKYEDYDAYNLTVAEAIKLDDVIPEAKKNMILTKEQLYRFAQWQTWLDENIPNRYNG